MPDMIAGPGVGLPLPQALTPASLFTTPFTPPTNEICLSPGCSFMVPAGTWFLHAGMTNTVTRIQWKDPVTRQWRPLLRPAVGPYTTTMRSDGFNYRMCNESGIPLSGNVTAGGSGYVQGTTNVVASAGASLWQAIVGGALGAVTIIDGGANYSLAPLVTVPSPPPPGVAAVGHAVLTAGAVTGIIWDVAGAGYTFPPQILITPDPFDQGLTGGTTIGSAIRSARASVVLTGAGTVTAVLITSNGLPVATAPTLTISGQGTGATATVNPTPWLAPIVDPTITVQVSSGP